MHHQFHPLVLYSPERINNAHHRIQMHDDVIFKLNEHSYLYTVNKIEHLELYHHYTMNIELPVTTFWYFT